MSRSAWSTSSSLLLTLNVGMRRLRVLSETRSRCRPSQALRQGFAYVWSTPDVRAATLLAFLMNFAAYPFVGSLLAHVAKDIYGLDQTRPGLADRLLRDGRARGLAHARHAMAPGSGRPAPCWSARCCGSRSIFVFSWITVPLPGRGAAGADRLRAKLLHGADGGDPVAHRRSRLSRPGDGRAHARRLRPAARHAAERPADRAYRLCLDRHAVQPASGSASPR